MSVPMAAVRTLIRVAKPLTGNTSDARVKKAIRPMPKQGGSEVQLGGTRCVWIERQAEAGGVVAYFHGGSYIGGPATAQWAWFRAVCRRVGMAGLFVDYPLAPQHSHPVALDSAAAAIAALRETSGAPLVLAGDSAGGGLAAALGLRLRDDGLPQPAASILVSPWLDLRMTDPVAASMAKSDAMLTVKGLDQAARAYAGSTDRSDPYLSPLLGDLTGLGPTLVTVGTAEMFLPEARTFADRCRDAGVEVELVEGVGGFHGYPVATFLPESKVAMDLIAAFVARHVP